MCVAVDETRDDARATGIDAQSGIWARRFDDGLIDAVDIALGRPIRKELA